VGEMDVKIFVNLEENKVTVQIVEKIEIFRDGKFVIFTDRHGIQYIQKENGRYKVVDILDGRRTEEEISEEEAKKIIRDTIRGRIEERLLNW
jgi:hypothetical protein